MVVMVMMVLMNLVLFTHLQTENEYEANLKGRNFFAENFHLLIGTTLTISGNFEI